MVTEQSPTRKIRLIDVVAALERRGRQDEIAYYGITLPAYINSVYNIPVEEIIMMTVDEISALSKRPQKPWKYEGWDTFFFGRAAFNGNG